RGSGQCLPAGHRPVTRAVRTARADQDAARGLCTYILYIHRERGCRSHIQREINVQRYFRPVPVLKTTTLSLARTKPLSRSLASAPHAAPPSGQTSMPVLEANSRAAFSDSSSVTVTAVPLVARNARKHTKPPRGEGTRSPYAFV